MKNKKNIVAIVPVKGNSVRVKKKNLTKFADSNLFQIKLKQLKKTSCFQKIIISSENKKILDYAKNNGFSTHLRDSYFSTSKVPMSEVYRYIASEIDGEYIAWINATNPLCNEYIYQSAVKKFKKISNNYDCFLSAVKNKQNYFYKNKPINFKRSPWPRSQDLKPLISLPFAISILKRKDMVKWGSCVGKKPFFYFLNPLVATDIDDQSSFKIAELLFKKKIFGLNKKKFIE
tara:strand:- start:1990 stop:2685 length:696 start_codon:yes stop_codon:yes gene_type:complete